MFEKQIIKSGDEVVIKDNEDYDILTVLRVKNGYAECFEYNPKQAWLIKLEDLELA